MIFCAFYFSYQLSNNDFSLFDRVDNTEKRFFPGKFFETFPVWYQYLRKSAPNEHIMMFNVQRSPIPIQEGLKFITEPYEFISNNSFEYNPEIKFHIKNASPPLTGEQQFPTVNDITRNFMDGLVFAYKTNNDYLWMDCDCFTNSNLEKYTKGYDYFSTNINHQLLTSNVHFIHISKERLHALDFLCNLPDVLLDIAYNGFDLIRRSTFFEGGLYKLFCYGNYHTTENINTTHLTTYPHFMEFLKRNPLDSEEYRNLVNLLSNVPKEVLNNCKLNFTDECFYESN